MRLLKEIQFLSWGFPFLVMSTFSRVQSGQFFTWNIHTVFFCIPFLLFRFVDFLFVCLLPLLLLTTVISLSLLFSWVCETLHLYNPRCWRVFFLFLFLTNITCLYHLSGVRLCAYSSIFCPFVYVPHLSILRRVQSILQERLHSFILVYLL